MPRRGRSRGASAVPASEPLENEENATEPGADNPADPPGAEAQGDESNFSEKKSLDEVQQAEKTKQMQPMMQAAAVALARERNWLASAMIHHFIEPLALEHRDNVKTLREGQQPTAYLYRKLALVRLSAQSQFPDFDSFVGSPTSVCKRLCRRRLPSKA